MSQRKYERRCASVLTRKFLDYSTFIKEFLSDNEYWVTNEPVFTWYGAGIDTNGHVTALLLEDNQLTGEMPSELGSLSSLIWLNLSRNQLSGEIPLELGNLSNLEGLSLVGNELSGCVPSGLINVEFNDLDDLGLPLCSDGN